MTLTVHGLLHIADTIERIGPVWTWWSFPVERQCGRLQRHINDKRHPYVNIDNFITLAAQLNNARNIYNITNEDLSLDKKEKGKKTPYLFEDCMFFPSVCSVGQISFCLTPDEGIVLHSKLAGGCAKIGEHSGALKSCLFTRFGLTDKKAQGTLWECLPSIFNEYKQVTIANGNRIRAFSHQGQAEEDTDRRDATFIQVSDVMFHIHPIIHPS